MNYLVDAGDVLEELLEHDEPLAAKKWTTWLTPAMYLKSSLNMMLPGDFFHLLEVMIAKGFSFSRPWQEMNNISYFFRNI